MLQRQRLRIAIQKKGRLNTDSTDLLIRCGIKFRVATNALLTRAENLPIDILLVRDDDIPTLVMDGFCDLGIVGENVLLEKAAYKRNNGYEAKFKIIKSLGFGCCRLAIAFPDDKPFVDLNSLSDLCIATSYPNLLQEFLEKNNINADVLTISGSVEISPRLGMADAICDLVSTGRTLEENNLTAVKTITESQAVLIQSEQTITAAKETTKALLLRRIDGVLKAQETKYIMFHAPKTALMSIREILPGCDAPTIMPLEGYQDKVAVHVVSPEGVFWQTLENLKREGAESILVLPIEKMMN